MQEAALVLGTIGFVLASAIALTKRFVERSEPGDDLTEAVNSLLPQSQCCQCGYPGCRPYAEALIHGEASNLCVPGGVEVAVAIADLLGSEPNTQGLADVEQTVVHISEEDCVGCGRCVEVCPVDAIVGAPNFVHTVLKEHCTGCELCLPPCPVDCIEIELVA